MLLTFAEDGQSYLSGVGKVDCGGVFGLYRVQLYEVSDSRLRMLEGPVTVELSRGWT